MDGRAEREPPDQLCLGVQELLETRPGLRPVHPRRESEEELLVSVLATSELSVESPELGIGERAGEERESLAAAGLDQRADEQPIDLEPGLGNALEMEAQALRPRVRAASRRVPR